VTTPNTTTWKKKLGFDEKKTKIQAKEILFKKTELLFFLRSVVTKDLSETGPSHILHRGRLKSREGSVFFMYNG
jgi:hypothetical protein